MQLESEFSKNKNTPSFNWRLFGVLLAMVIFGLLAMIPYGLTLASQDLTRSTLLGLVPQFLVQIVLNSFFIWTGLKLAGKVGLKVNWLTAWAQGESVNLNFRQIGFVVWLGIIAGIGIIILDVFIFAPALVAEQALTDMTIHPPAWQGLLASFYGGIVEEVMMRLFLVTFLAWLGSKIFKRENSKPSAGVMWVAILVSGLAFGLGHLPSAVVMGIKLTPLYIFRSFALNGVGILYGWLYWKRGFESAILAHFSTDIVVHVLAAALLTLR